MKNKIMTKNAPKAVGPYSQAIEVNNTLYVSGQLPLNPETMEAAEGIAEQTRQSLENAKNIIEEAGYTFADVVKATVLLADINDFKAMNDVYATYFLEPYPARIAYEVANLPLGVKVEIDFILAK